MKKTYIIDTNVLIDDPYSFQKFADSEIILPIAVVDELDKLKKDPSAGKGARVAIKLLDEISSLGDISTGILLENNSLVKIDIENYTINQGDPLYGDTRILACAKHYHDQGNDVIVVSNDFNLRVRAKATGILSEGYQREGGISFSELYEGIQDIVNEDAGYALLEHGIIDPKEFNLDLYINECVCLLDNESNLLAVGRKVSEDKLKSVKKSYPWNLNPRNKEQAFAVDLIMDENIDLVTLIGGAGTGKAQPLDAYVLTPYGFKKMGDLNVGDLVSTPNGENASIIGIFPQGEKDIYKVSFSDGSFTECCEDHLWATKTSKERDSKKEWKIRDTKEISNSLFYKTKKNHSIPITKPIQLEKKVLPVKPYTFGVLLGDGSFRNNLSLTNVDEEIINVVDNELKEINLKLEKNVNHKYSYDVRCINAKTKTYKKIVAIDSEKNEVIYQSTDDAAKILSYSKYGIYKALSSGKVYKNLNWKYLNKQTNNSLLNYLRDIDLWMKKSEDKFIPNEYKYSNISDRIELLQGLLDTDGTISTNGHIEYYTVSKQLSEDVRWLIESLGGTANTNIKKGSYKKNGVKIDCQLCYRITVVLPSEIVPFKLARKKNRVKPRVKYFPRRYITGVELVGKKQAQCIMIDSLDHLYMTNNCIVTHNTLCALAASLELVINQAKYNKLVIYRPMQAVGADLGYLPGNEAEKLAPWFEAVMDSFEVLFTNNKTKGNKHKDWREDLEMFIDKGQIEMNALTFIRGRSIPNAIILIDESQNLSKEDIKTIITRAGEGTKIILTGDLEQIDNKFLDSSNNGLAYVIEKFKGSDIFGHVTFIEGERSRLATEAAEVL